VYFVLHNYVDGSCWHIYGLIVVVFVSLDDKMCLYCSKEYVCLTLLGHLLCLLVVELDCLDIFFSYSSSGPLLLK